MSKSKSVSYGKRYGVITSSSSSLSYSFAFQRRVFGQSSEVPVKDVIFLVPNLKVMFLFPAVGVITTEI
jgi:hypothetical protein